jgi:DivIVA domain-containing protein
MVTPDEIENRVFSLVRRGYDPAEVDEFLKEVASSLAQAQGGLATPPTPTPEPVGGEPDGGVATLTEPPAPTPAPEVVISGADDFGRLGEEVAQILRQAHESVAALRHRAEAEAALIRQNAQHEADALRADADRDRQAAGVALEAAQAEAARILAEANAASEATAAATAAVAAARSQEVIDAAKVDARDAVLVQRNVRGRLEGTRDDIDHALDRLVEEDEDLFEGIDLTDSAMAAEAEAEEVAVDEPVDVPPPGQGPPSAAIPPPVHRPQDLDLPYATDDEDDTIDLTDGGGGPDDVAPPPPVDPGPQPVEPDGPPPLGDTGGAAAEVPDAPAADDGEEDALAQMVKNAVENALKRRKGDDPASGNGG